MLATLDLAVAACAPGWCVLRWRRFRWRWACRSRWAWHGPGGGRRMLPLAWAVNGAF